MSQPGPRSRVGRGEEPGAREVGAEGSGRGGGCGGKQVFCCALSQRLRAKWKVSGQDGSLQDFLP